MTPKQVSEETGIAKNHVYEILKSIRELSFIPIRVRTVLKALKWRIEIVKDD